MPRVLRTSLLIAILSLVLGVPLIFAAPSDQPATFLPLVLSAPPTPTRTPAPTPTQQPSAPTPEAPCDQNAPAPAEGTQAWMTVQNPARFSKTTVCVRLIQAGQIVPGAPMNATAHYRTTTTNLGSAAAGADGVAHITFSIGSATSGYMVVVDGSIAGHAFATSFRPQ